MKFTRVGTCLLLLIGSSLFAQTSPPAGLVDIKQGFKKLNVLGSVLMIAAHPDDENTQLLAYLAREKNYRTGYLSLTRGDGGQNLIGNEQGEQLGLIRTQELLAARRADGAEQFFSRANDFGFSKGPDETLKIWDKEKVLSDVVWVIRKFKPDVIICRFPTTGQGGHGHHTASAILAQEAFTAAADPTRFPEQLQYVQPWQAKRLLWNTFNFGGVNTTSEDQLKVDIGVYNPLLGKSYGEIAAESRSDHKSQGMGTPSSRGEAFTYFKTILGDAPKLDLFDDINTGWQRVLGGTDIQATLNTILKGFDENAPERSVPAMVQLLTHIERLPDTYWRDLKAKELKDLIAACAGLWFEAYSAEPAYAIGDSINVRCQLLNRYSDRVKLYSITASHTLPIAKYLPANQLQVYDAKAFATKITQPYWLLTPHTLGTFNIPDQQLVGNPENPDLPTVKFEFIIEGKPIAFERRLVYKYVDPVRGEVYQPVAITPPVTANFDSKVLLFKDKQAQQVTIDFKSFTQCSGSMALKAPNGWNINPKQVSFTNKAKGEEWSQTFTLSPAEDALGTDVASAVVTVNGTDYNMSLQQIRHDHIPAITLFSPAEVKLVKLDLKIAGKNIGYIAGAGDMMPDALRQVGYTVTMLTEDDIMNGSLAGYDAIVTGVRAYNVNPRLVVEQAKLLDYVKNGGNLLVQYNNDRGLVLTNIGPYPFTPENKRITDETAAVTFVDAASPVLNYPNKINADDFNNWVQERGLYYVTNIDPQYKTILTMNDLGEKPNNGALIVADYGRGRFVYTSLAFFRQLPAGNPGAYRLFVNLLSKPLF